MPGPARDMSRAAQLTVEPSRHISRRCCVPTKPAPVRVFVCVHWHARVARDRMRTVDCMCLYLRPDCIGVDHLAKRLHAGAKGLLAAQLHYM